MKIVKDAKGRDWNLSVDIASLKRVRDVCDLDLVNLAASNVIEKLHDDPVLVAGVVYVILKPQLDAKGMTEESFCEGLAGGELDDMTKALFEDLIDFFPGRRGRLFKKAMAKVMKAVDKGLDVIDKRIDTLDVEGPVVAEVTKGLEKLKKPVTSGKSSGEPPASSASTPDP